MDLPIEMGTLQLNLLREFDNEVICIAQRNLDPFTSLSEEQNNYPFKMINREKYLNL